MFSSGMLSGFLVSVSIAKPDCSHCSVAGEEFGKDYVPPESQKISPAFFKKI